MTRSAFDEERQSPFALEHFEHASTRRAPGDPAAALAGLARGLAPEARRHVERALVRQLVDRGVRDRRHLAAAVADLRREWVEREAAPAAAHEVVEQELAGLAPEQARECRCVSGGSDCSGGCHAAGEYEDGPGAGESEFDVAEECEESQDEAAEGGAAVWFDEPEEAHESLWRDELGADDEGEFEDVGEALEAGDDEAPWRDEEDEADEWREVALDAPPASESEDPAGWEAVLSQAEVEDEAEDDQEQEDETLALDGEGLVDMESEVPEPAEIGRSLDAIQVRTTRAALRQAPNPFDLNAVASKNTPSKRAVFKALQKTWISLNGVERKLAAQPKPALEAKLEARRAALVRQRDERAAALKAWLLQHSLDHSRDLQAARANLRAKKRLLAQYAGQKKHAAKADKLRADVRASETALPLMEDSLRAAAVAFEPLKDFTQNHHEARVPSASATVRVKLHDHVVAFATDTREGLEGSTDGDTPAGVAAALERAPIGADRRAILRLLSQHEGTFTNVNTWDRAVITFGFIQWTTDAAGDGTLTGLMEAVREAAPDVYRSCFQRFGLDLGRANGRRVFKLTLPDGSQLLAGPAARHVQKSVRHVAALSAAGLDPAVQAAQIRVAVEGKLDGMLARSVAAGGQSARLRDLLTSEYGVAVLTDRATGTGEGGTRDAAQRGFAAHMKAHPDADLSRAAERQAAGARVLQALEALDPSRAKDYAVLSHEPGSFSV